VWMNGATAICAIDTKIVPSNGNSALLRLSAPKRTASKRDWRRASSFLRSRRAHHHATTSRPTSAATCQITSGSPKSRKSRAESSFRKWFCIA